jgi:hypothetical protein
MTHRLILLAENVALFLKKHRCDKELEQPHNPTGCTEPGIVAEQAAAG